MKKVNDNSMEVNDTSKENVLFLNGKRIILIFLAILILLLLLFPIAKFIHDRFCPNHNGASEGTTDSIANKNLTQGTIYTDVENANKEDENISRYTLGEGYSEVENSTENNSGSNSSRTSASSYVDYSSLSGNSIAISEGEYFQPLSALNLNATDKDGSNISNKIAITANNVNVEKPGYYSVSASVKLSSGQTLQRTFSVQVKATNLNVKVNSFKSLESKVTKGEKVNFTLDITSSKSYVKASAVNINGKNYPVYGDGSTTSNNQNYKVKVDSGDLIGVQDYKLSYITMSDNTIINVDNTVTVEVLKSEAKIKDFKYETNSLTKKIYMDFKLEDLDNSASNVRIEAYKENELISSRNLDKKEVYEERVTTDTNGLYEIKILADINVYSNTNEENTILNKVLFSESVNVTNVDESLLSGNDVEIVEGEAFDIELLNIKARDVDGEDITDKVTIRSNNVNNNVAGSYKVIANFTNKNNKKIEKTFKVTVVKPVITEESDNNDDLGTDLSTIFVLDRNSNEVKASRALTNGTISGNDTETLDANVTVTGNITKADGTVASGKIQVEVPTSLAFSIDQVGNFNGTVFNIKNSSDSEISVSVGQFKETKTNSGITVRSLNEDLTNMDRSNIHLYLQGDNVIDLGETLVSDIELIAIPASDSKAVQLLGNAGKADGAEVDTNGASEEFNLVFKIKKR